MTKLPHVTTHRRAKVVAIRLIPTGQMWRMPRLDATPWRAEDKLEEAVARTKAQATRLDQQEELGAKTETARNIYIVELVELDQAWANKMEVTVPEDEIAAFQLGAVVSIMMSVGYETQQEENDGS